MKISIITLILLIPAFFSSSAQVKNKDYEILAKAAILKYAINLDYPDIYGVNPVFLSSAIQKVEDIVKKTSYSYDVEVIDSILSFQVISIIDKSNFQLHGLHRTLFAINKSDSIYRYSEINDNNLLEFINNRIYPEIKNKDKFRLIQFYNKVFAYLNSGFLKFEFYDKNNEKDFQALDKLYRFRDIVSKDMIGKRDHYEHIYRIFEDNTDPVDFYRVLYWFECDKLRVEKVLLLRTMISDQEESK